MKTLGELYEFLKANPQYHKLTNEYVTHLSSVLEDYTIIHYPDGQTKLMDIDSKYTKVGTKFFSGYISQDVIVSEISEDGKEIWLEEDKP